MLFIFHTSLQGKLTRVLAHIFVLIIKLIKTFVSEKSLINNGTMQEVIRRHQMLLPLQEQQIYWGYKCNFPIGKRKVINTQDWISWAQ